MARLSRKRYEEHLRQVRLLATDVDGVLTDGSILYGDGDWEGKVFHVRDGSAMHLAKLVGLETAVITGRTSEAVDRRFRELPVGRLYQGAVNKVGACLEIQEALGIEDREVAYIGDDLLDLPLIEHAGVGIAVADCHPILQERADWLTGAPGGGGAVREVVDDFITANDLWDDVLSSYRERQETGVRAASREG